MIDPKTQKTIATLEKIRDILLKYGGTHEQLDKVCNQIEDLYAELMGDKQTPV